MVGSHHHPGIKVLVLLQHHVLSRLLAVVLLLLLLKLLLLLLVFALHDVFPLSHCLLPLPLGGVVRLTDPLLVTVRLWCASASAVVGMLPDVVL